MYLIYLLQETYSTQKDELVWKSEWGGHIFFSRGSNHQKGLCILIDPVHDFQVSSHFSDADGRIAIINLTIKKTKFNTCSIYAPNNLAQQFNFVQTIK